MIVHPGALNEAMEARTAGRNDEADTIVDKYIPHWCGTLLRLAGVKITVTGRENIPEGQPCLFAANHRSYFDIPVVLTSLDRPHGILAKAETDKIPYIRKWMRALDCVFVRRDDVKDSLKAFTEVVKRLKNGRSFVIFPEGTRYKGNEGEIGEFKNGTLRMAVKAGVPIVPIAISGTRACMEGNHMLVTPSEVTVRILEPVSTDGLDKEAQKQLTAELENRIREALNA